MYALIALLLYSLTKLGSGNASQYSTGSFVVTYDTQELPSIKIKWDDKLVWFSSPSLSSKPVLYAETVSSKVEQIGGDYSIKNKVVDACYDWKPTNFSARAGGQGEELVVFLQGKLCNEIDAELDFQAVAVAGIYASGRDSMSQLQFRASMKENPRFNSLRLVYGSDQDEGFYGFGAQYSKWNMKGQKLPLFLSEQGVGRGLEPITLILDALSHNAGKSWVASYTQPKCAGLMPNECSLASFC